MPNLEPCPICGKLPLLSTLEPEHHSNKYFCGVHVSCGDWKPTEEEAALDWNRRTKDTTQPDLHKLTNADRIRAMSDEALADQLVISLKGIAPCTMWAAPASGKMYLTGESAAHDMLAWLRQPAEEE